MNNASFKEFLNEAPNKVNIKGEQYTMKVVLSQKPNGQHKSPIWHLAFLGKSSTIVILNALFYKSGYNQGNASGMEWFLSTPSFGTEGSGYGSSRPSTPYIEDEKFGKWYVDALNNDRADVLEYTEFVDHKMSIKEIKAEFN